MKNAIMFWPTLNQLFFLLCLVPAFGFGQIEESEEIALADNPRGYAYNEARKEQYLIRSQLPSAQTVKEFGASFWVLLLHPNQPFRTQWSEVESSLESQFGIKWPEKVGDLWLSFYTGEYSPLIHGVCEEEEKYLESIGLGSRGSQSIPWSPEELPKFAKFFEANEKFVDVIAELVKRHDEYYESTSIREYCHSLFFISSYDVLPLFDRAATRRGIEEKTRMDYLLARHRFARLNSRSLLFDDVLASYAQSSLSWIIATDLLNTDVVSPSSVLDFVASVDNGRGLTGPEEFLLPIEHRVSFLILEMVKAKKVSCLDLVNFHLFSGEGKSAGKAIQNRVDQLRDDDVFWDTQARYVEGYFEAVRTAFAALKSKNYLELSRRLDGLKAYRVGKAGLSPDDPYLMGKIALIGSLLSGQDRVGSLYSGQDWKTRYEQFIYAQLENQVRRDLLVLAAILKEEIICGRLISTDLSVYKSNKIEFGDDPFSGKDYQVIDRGDSLVIFSAGLGGEGPLTDSDLNTPWHNGLLRRSERAYSIIHRPESGKVFGKVKWAIVLNKR